MTALVDTLATALVDTLVAALVGTLATTLVGTLVTALVDTLVTALVGTLVTGRVVLVHSIGPAAIKNIITLHANKYCIARNFGGLKFWQITQIHFGKFNFGAWRLVHIIIITVNFG